MSLRTDPPTLAMQYRFALPADYDMAIVERRIAEKGPALDGWPGLRAKALSFRLPRRDATREPLRAVLRLGRRIGDERLPDRTRLRRGLRRVRLA
jgi:hypothetical protein